MPRHPQVAPSLAGIGSSVFSGLAHRLATHKGEVYPLHVGDTWLEPAEGCRMQDLKVEQHPGMHRYAPPQGLLPLLKAVADRSTERHGIPTEPRQVLITAGATGAIGAVLGAILEPGEQVLVLAPYWPLITGIIRCFHGEPVIVPLIGHADSPETALECVRRHHGSKVAALYLSSPNNPTGRILPRPWLEALAEWARRENLWIIADEVYEDYAYTSPHTYCRSLAPERTFSAHSFSKAYGMAGNRCGYVVGPAERMSDLCKVSTHSFYATPTASQLAALAALDGRGDAWVAKIRPQYRAAGDAAADRLGLDPPEGSTFLFLDVAPALSQGGLATFLDSCADSGLFLAPGPSFGPYPTHVRICFTSAAPEIVGRGVEVLAKLLGR